MKDLTIKDLANIDNDTAFNHIIQSLAKQFNLEVIDNNTDFLNEDEWRVHYIISHNDSQALDLWLELRDESLMMSTNHVKFNDNKGLLSKDIDFLFEGGECYDINNKNKNKNYIHKEMAKQIVELLDYYNMNGISDVYSIAKQVINEPNKPTLKP